VKKRDNQESCSILLEKQIGELSGMVTGQKVLDIKEEECTLKIEVSISGSGRFRGMKFAKVQTYYSLHRADGSIYGEGKGVIMTKNGNELATVTGRSIGKHTSQEK
jgi:hypothetical protein